MNIVVTGANGFVGQSLIDVLHANGHHVRALTRRQEAQAGADSVVQWSGVDDALAVSRACVGADVVVHLAARVHKLSRGDRDAHAEFDRINVDGSSIVARAARDAGVRHLVYLSTIKVHGDGGGTAPYTERSPLAPSDAYAKSKVDAEAALAAVATPAMAITAIRPPLVFGPGVRANFARLVGLARTSQRWPLPLGHIGNRRSLLYVGNLAAAIERVARAPATGFRAFVLADDPPLSTSDLLRHLASALDRPARLWHVPAAVLHAGAALLGRSADMHRLLDSLVVDSTAFRQRFDWMPPVPLTQSLAATALALGHGPLT